MKNPKPALLLDTWHPKSLLTQSNIVIPQPNKSEVRLILDFPSVVLFNSPTRFKPEMLESYLKDRWWVINDNYEEANNYWSVVPFSLSLFLRSTIFYKNFTVSIPVILNRWYIKSLTKRPSSFKDSPFILLPKYKTKLSNPNLTLLKR